VTRQRRRPAREWIPIPDPTALTSAAVTAATDQWRRELEAVRDTIGHQIDTVNGTLTARLDASDTAAALRLQALHDVRPQTERLIAHQRELIDERFRGVDQRFDERDVRSEQEKKAAKEALDAALLAQKESVAQQNAANTTAATKSEISFTKQFDQIGTLVATMERSINDRITELKERIDRGEGGTAGSATTRADTRLNIGQVVGALGVLVAVVALIYALTR
jgi:hypothetical protein